MSGVDSQKDSEKLLALIQKHYLNEEVAKLPRLMTVGKYRIDDDDDVGVLVKSLKVEIGKAFQDERLNYLKTEIFSEVETLSSGLIEALSRCTQRN